LVPRVTKLSAIDVTAKAFFERYLVLGLRKIATLPMHPQPRPITVQLFLVFCAIFVPEWPLNFFSITIHQVIWPVHQVISVPSSPEKTFLSPEKLDFSQNQVPQNGLAARASNKQMCLQSHLSFLLNVEPHVQQLDDPPRISQPRKVHSWSTSLLGSRARSCEVAPHFN